MNKELQIETVISYRTETQTIPDFFIGGAEFGEFIKEHLEDNVCRDTLWNRTVLRHRRAADMKLYLESKTLSVILLKLETMLYRSNLGEIPRLAQLPVYAKILAALELIGQENPEYRQPIAGGFSTLRKLLTAGDCLPAPNLLSLERLSDFREKARHVAICSALPAPEVSWLIETLIKTFAHLPGKRICFQLPDGDAFDEFEEFSLTEGESFNFRVSRPEKAQSRQSAIPTSRLELPHLSIARIC